MATDQPPMKRRQAGGGRPGRRPGRPDTRETILDAAYQAFTSQGFRAATAKSIADDASVDPAMINYFFGSRQGLFREVLYRHHEPAARQAEVAENVSDDSAQGMRGMDFAERLIREVLRAWDRPETQSLLSGLILSAGEDPQTDELILAVGDSTGEVVEKQLTEAGMDSALAHQRSAVIVAMNMGMVYARYIVKSPVVAQMSLDDVVAQYAPAIRGLLAD
ncbi:TetR/AcrR family transcriptional regulator [Tomitella cavernea]|nr:TetR/AcrR family transcriptional regulator [Tomitella cavernea]